MDADFMDVTEKGNKKIAVILILIIIGILVFGYFFVYQKNHFALKNITLEIGDTLSTDINYFLKKSVVDTAGYKLDTSKVNNNEIGEYTYTITYSGKTSTGKVKVVDTKPPVFTTKELSVEVGDEDFFLGDFLTSCEDLSKPCIVTLKNEKDEEKFSKVGVYDIKIVVEDVYKNKSEATVKLNVVEKGTLIDERTTDLEYVSASIELDDFVDQYYEKLDKAIPASSEEARDKMSNLSAIDLENYVTENYEGYTLKGATIIELYNKSDYVIGYAIKITISNGTERTVYVYNKTTESSE